MKKNRDTYFLKAQYMARKGDMTERDRAGFDRFKRNFGRLIRMAKILDEYEETLGYGEGERTKKTNFAAWANELIDLTDSEKKHIKTGTIPHPGR